MFIFCRECERTCHAGQTFHSRDNVDANIRWQAMLCHRIIPRLRVSFAPDRHWKQPCVFRRSQPVIMHTRKHTHTQARTHTSIRGCKQQMTTLRWRACALCREESVQLCHHHSSPHLSAPPPLPRDCPAPPTAPPPQLPPITSM